MSDFKFKELTQGTFKLNERNGKFKWLGDKSYDPVHDPLNTFVGAIVRFFSRAIRAIVKLEANFTPIQELPDYQFVEYIESSGTQYINTGISLNEDDFRIECRFARTEATTAEQPIVSIWEGTSKYWNAFVNSGSLVDIYTEGHHFPQNTAITNGTQYDLTIQRSTNHWKATLSGSEVTWDYTPSKNNSTTVKLFTRGDVPGTSGANTHAKIYYVKIYRNGTLVGNFAPAVRPSDSAIGMYDSVSKTFFANAGTGTFAKGSNIAIPNPIVICPISGHDGCDIFDKAEYDAAATPTVSISFGQTVYSGTLTVNEDGSGQVVADRVTKEVTSSTTKNGTRTNSKGVFNANYLLSNGGDRSKTIICNSLGIYTATNIYNGGDPLTVGLSSDSKSLYVMSTTSISSVSAFDDWLDSIGTIQVCYYLATPITIPLSPGQINTLVGTNTIWVNDATGDITVQAYGTEIT